MADVPFQLSVRLGEAEFNASGATDRVMAAFEKFEALLDGSPPSTSPTKGKTGQSVPPKAPVLKTGSDKPVLPVFLKELNPKGNRLVATAIVAWGQLHDGRPGLKASEVRELWRKTNFKAPGNINRDMEKAASEGYLHRAGNDYTVTGFGKTTLGIPD